MAYIFKNNADTNILQLTEIVEHKVIITIVAIGVITTKLMFTIKIQVVHQLNYCKSIASVRNTK